jgi:hypothetical protein
MVVPPDKVTVSCPNHGAAVAGQLTARSVTAQSVEPLKLVEEPVMFAVAVGPDAVSQTLLPVTGRTVMLGPLSCNEVALLPLDARVIFQSSQASVPDERGHGALVVLVDQDDDDVVPTPPASVDELDVLNVVVELLAVHKDDEKLCAVEEV